MLSPRSGRAGEGGSRPGEKEALLDAERATSGVVYSTSRSSFAIRAETDPRGPFGQIQQSSRQARASKGVAADWRSSRDVASTGSTRWGGDRLCLPRSHFAS